MIPIAEVGYHGTTPSTYLGNPGLNSLSQERTALPPLRNWQAAEDEPSIINTTFSQVRGARQLLIAVFVLRLVRDAA